MAAMLPRPPISATKRPPGARARCTPAITACWSRTQCSAALLKTASNAPANCKSVIERSTTASPRARAAVTIEESTSRPVTTAPVAASDAVSAPSPQPRSSTRSPGFASSHVTISPARSATNRPFAAYCCASHCCVCPAAICQVLAVCSILTRHGTAPQPS